MTGIVIVDPDDLTPDERKLADSYAEMGQGEFDQVVRRFLNRPDDSTRQVLFSADLAQDTLAALGRLHAEALHLANGAQPRSSQRRLMNERVRLIAGMRAELRPYVSMAAHAAADQGVRHRAERVLGQVRYAELRQIMRDLEAGMTEREAADAHRARLREREEIAGQIDGADGR